MYIPENICGLGVLYKGSMVTSLLYSKLIFVENDKHYIMCSVHWVGKYILYLLAFSCLINRPSSRLICAILRLA